MMMMMQSMGMRGYSNRPSDDVDPTPATSRAGADTEQMAGGGESSENIASSQGAYDSSSPRPQQSARQIEHEKPVDMDRTAASNEPAEHAMKGGNPRVDTNEKSRQK